MLLSQSPRGAELIERVREFNDTEITPVEASYRAELAEARAAGKAWEPLPRMRELQTKARVAGLWNPFLPAGHGDAYAEKFGTSGGAGLSNVD
jgi:acyl-CoA dehydrogenase